MTWVAAGVAGATVVYGGIQTAKGSAKANKAREALEADSNKDPIPEAHKERLRRLRDRESMSLPGQSKIEQDIGASTAQGITAFKEMGNQANFQDFISQSVQNEQDQLRNLGIEAAEFKIARQQDVDEALRESADYETAQRQRERELLEADLASGEAQKGAGTQNIISGGLSAATSIAGGIRK